MKLTAENWKKTVIDKFAHNFDEGINSSLDAEIEVKELLDFISSILQAVIKDLAGKEKKNNDRQKKLCRKWIGQNKERYLELQRKGQKRYNQRYPEKIFAHNIANAKKLRGSVCEICGEIDCLEGHHPNYNEPELIITLCQDCHNFIHYAKTQKKETN